jgi:hypothetical protein
VDSFQVSGRALTKSTLFRWSRQKWRRPESGLHLESTGSLQRVIKTEINMTECRAGLLPKPDRTFTCRVGGKRPLSRHGKRRSFISSACNALYPALAALIIAIQAAGVAAQASDPEEVRAIARLYSAAFDREPKVDGLNFWVNSYEGGSSLTAIAGRFYSSPEFTRKYGPLDNTEYVEQLFRNVLGREGAEGGIDFWVGNLDSNSTRARVLGQFAESPENVSKTAATFASMRYQDGQWVFKPDYTNNLIAHAVDVDSGFPRIGYPLEVSVEIEAVEDTREVSVAFFAIDKDREPARQLVLDAVTIEQVYAGNYVYALEIDVPTSLKTAGAYYIGAIVDAADFIGETDEEDNDTSTETTMAPAEAPNLFIVDMEPDRNAIVLDRSAYNYDDQAELGVVNSDAGGTISWGVKGAVTPVPVEAFAVMRLTRTYDGASHDVPLYLWNTVAQRYMNAYGVSPEQGVTGEEEWLPVGAAGEQNVVVEDGSGRVDVSEFDPRSAHLDFYFPGGLALELEIALRDLPVLFNDGPIEPPPDLSASEIAALRSFLFRVEPETLESALCVKIRPSNRQIREDRTDDNETCSPLALVLPPLLEIPPTPIIPPVPPVNPEPTNPLVFEKRFEAEWSGDNFGFGVSFGNMASADNRGVIVTADGSLPIKVFGFEFEYMGVDGRAQVIPLSDRDNPPPDQHPGFSLELRHVGLILSSVTVGSGVVGPLQLAFTKELKKSKPKVVFVGPVPVKLEASVTGNIGVEYTVAFGEAARNGLQLSTGPFANIEAGASAAVTIGVADVGVEGVITLVEEKFQGIYSATINVLDERHSDGTSEIVIVPRLRLVNEITGARGALGVFVKVEVPTVKKCSWGVFTGLCPGLKSIKYPYTLANWTAYQKTDTLFDEEQLISVITYPDGSSAYFK